jgi:serine/threonine-protein kinase
MRDTSTLDFVTVPENSEDRRAFLQARVALFGRMLAIISSLFLAASASSYFLLAPAPSLATRLSLDRYDLMAIGLFALLWAVTRRGRLARPALELLEAGAAVLACTGYALMVAASNRELNILVPPLSALAILMARAVFIPTTPRRTFVVSLVGSLPSIVVADVLAHRLQAETSIPSVIGPTVYVACWAGMTVALTTVTSRIIYGLEQKVRAARKLGQYTLQERIGAGGMAVVYRASHAMLRRATAVKVLPPEKMGAQNLARFEREVQLTSQLTHPNTISIYDYGRTPDGLFYYAMEFLDGFTLTELVETAGPLPPARVAWLMRQVAGSLDEAHGVGLIHRDIKPDNIIVCDRGGLSDFVKVLDFGLVKEFRSADPALSQSDAVIGTPLYMAPESFTVPTAVGVATDIYALGAVAYYLAAGREVFRGKTFAEVCAQHLMKAPESPSRDLARPLPDALEQLILGCLAKKPEDRPAGARAVEGAFATLVDGWTQDAAKGWWRAHRAELARHRAAKATYSPNPDRGPILRSVTDDGAYAETVRARM